MEKKCSEKGTFFFFTNWWKHAMMSLLYMPVELYVQLSVPIVETGTTAHKVLLSTES